MVLTLSHLFTYKDQQSSQPATMQISLSSILSLQLIDTTSCLRVNTPTRTYLLDCLSTSQDWARAIEQTRSLTFRKRTEQLSESRQNSEVRLFHFFNNINSLLSERFCRLQEDLICTKKEELEAAKTAVVALEDSVVRFEEAFARFERIYTNSDLTPGQKLQLLKGFNPDNCDCKEFDAILEAKTTVSVPISLPASILRSSLQVFAANIDELMVRRGPTTRALKWSYNGERLDALSFSVSKGIKLLGVGVCRPYRSGRVVKIREIKVVAGLTTRSPEAYRGNEGEEIGFNEGESVYRVQLTTQPQLHANSIYTVVLQLEGDNTFKCVDCARTVEGQGAVTWTYMSTSFQEPDLSNRTDEICGPIADFYYMLAA